MRATAPRTAAASARESEDRAPGQTHGTMQGNSLSVSCSLPAAPRRGYGNVAGPRLELNPLPGRTTTRLLTENPERLGWLPEPWTEFSKVA